VTGAAADQALETSADERALVDILARLESQLDDLVEAAAAAIFAEIPAYRVRAGSRLPRDVRNHVREHISATLATFRERGQITPEDLVFIRRHAAARAGQLSVADFIHAFQVGQRILWSATLAMAEDDGSRRAVLSLVAHITRYFEVAVTHAAEVYLEAEQMLGAAGERLRRDTLEDLLAGAPIAPGPREQTLREAGLDARCECLVITARAIAPVEDEHELRSAASTLARVPRRATTPLTVISHGEIVIVSPARRREVRGLVERLGSSQRRLADRGVGLAVGMSTLHCGLAEVPVAYREAVDASELLGGEPGMLALPAMTSFDYLVRHSNPTARRLIPEAVAQFVADDADQGGVLVATLRAYAAADLNVTKAAEQLHIHVNTARYRLAKIEERTGVDLRHVGDVIELLIAAQLAEAAPAD
jgi:PucR C-terminal helix-turn-helix domain/GGDEF-like domain